MVTGHLEKRFGTIAVKKGFITKEQLVKATNIQLEQNLAGMEHMPIGSILYSLGYITIAQIREVLHTMDIPIKDS
jgi:hypothetical protein